MSRDTILARGRSFAEVGMADACTIQRLTGGTTDPLTGAPSPTYTDLYAGKCRVQQAGALARPHEVAEDRVLVVRFELQLPSVGTEGLKVDDLVTITASVHDADLIGRVFFVFELAHKSEATARRIGMIERTG